MNKKLALLLFAIGLGAASAPALADSCQSYCIRAYNYCLDHGGDYTTCTETFDQCMMC